MSLLTHIVNYCAYVYWSVLARDWSFSATFHWTTAEGPASSQTPQPSCVPIGGARGPAENNKQVRVSSVGMDAGRLLVSKHGSGCGRGPPAPRPPGTTSVCPQGRSHPTGGALVAVSPEPLCGHVELRASLS